jgi:hypothetical protein
MPPSLGRQESPDPGPIDASPSPNLRQVGTPP